MSQRPSSPAHSDREPGSTPGGSSSVPLTPQISASSSSSGL